MVMLSCHQTFWPTNVTCEWWPLMNEQRLYNCPSHKFDMHNLFIRTQSTSEIQRNASSRVAQVTH